jgi:D-lactate dehydrogenase
VRRTERKGDAPDLSEKHRRFHEEILRVVPASRVFCDPFRTFAYGTDASFYRLVPKIVVKAVSRAEIVRILVAAARHAVPVTFRAAGTSLSGQAVSDSVLVVLSGAWRGHEIHDGGERIALEPGLLGAEANALLSPYGRKIGPDPASINHCMIGGIAANNASGMCCGTAENSYRTVESMKVVLHDGTLLDTADPGSRASFLAKHPALVSELERIRDEIFADPVLAGRIREKFRIKNTTGYSLNAFTDYSDPVDILLHLMIGSEGTLGFIAEITYRTVVEHANKATALIVFPDLGHACRATIALKQGPVSAVELMDRASLRSVEAKEGMPTCLSGLSKEAAALLVETRAGDPAALSRQVEAVRGLLRPVPTVYPASFTDVKREYEALWNVRKGLFPAVGAARKVGTTVVIEDVVFPIERLADATLDLSELMARHGYEEGIIFGHALEGNLHFVFTQDFDRSDEVDRYRRLMEGVCGMVVDKYDGSLKGEHGTGRNMAPFVEREWGEKAYGLMVRVKKAFDPDNLLNPGVVINDDTRVHLKDLKPLPPVHEIIDRCIECGFCEVMCPSKELTTTPRQRITVQREISRLRSAGGPSARRVRLEADYRYLGDDTCATDGLCATTCPVSINTGEHTKVLRARESTSLARAAAHVAAGRYSAVAAAARGGLAAAAAARGLLGEELLERISRGLRGVSGERLPAWNPWLPLPARSARFAGVRRGRGRSVVYFPSCIVRAMGSSPRDRDPRPLFDATLSLLDKGGYDVTFPKGMERLCCGMPFESKGYPEEADRKAQELGEALLETTRGGEIPVLFDTSPCAYTMKRKADPRLRIHEPAEFVHAFLLKELSFRKSRETVALHVTCSSVKMGVADKLIEVARACAADVVVPKRVGCCGFAGDKGFTRPELNASALSELAAGLPPGCGAGYSNSRTCEIGLSLHGGIPYQSILYLVDSCASAPPDP